MKTLIGMGRLPNGKTYYRSDDPRENHVYVDGCPGCAFDAGDTSVGSFARYFHDHPPMQFKQTHTMDGGGYAWISMDQSIVWLDNPAPKDIP